jgi:hypothetical protein
MKILTQLRIYVVLTTLAFLALLVNYMNLREDLNKCQTDTYHIPGGDITKANVIDSLQIRYDSLHWEQFRVQVELGRYEVAYQIFMERNPEAAKQYGDIISNETE